MISLCQIWYILARSSARGVTGLQSRCHLDVSSSRDSARERVLLSPTAAGKLHFLGPACWGSLVLALSSKRLYSNLAAWPLKMPFSVHLFFQKENQPLASGHLIKSVLPRIISLCMNSPSVS